MTFSSMHIKLPPRKIDYSSSTIEREARYMLYMDDTAIEYCQKTKTTHPLTLVYDYCREDSDLG
jgi:hypothetical protein